MSIIHPPPRDSDTPPHDLAAERAALGAIVLSPTIMADVVASGIVTADYHDVAHQWVWSAMVALHADGRPVDHALLYGALKQCEGELGERAAALLAELVRDTPSAANWRYYVERVLERAKRRRLLTASDALAAAARNGKAPDSAVGDAMRLLGGAQAPEHTVSASASARKEIVPYRAFPVEVMPGAVGQFVAEAASAIGCDASFVALPTLACLARAIGNKRTIRLKRTWQEPAIIWAAIVGKSGTHKTPALSAASATLQRKQAEAMAQYEEALRTHEQDRARYEKDYAAWKRSKSTEPPPWEPVEPALARYIVSDITIEALADRLRRQFDGVLVLRDELAGWLGGIAEYKGGQGSDLGHWLASWSGQPLTVDRKTGAIKTVHVPRAAVNIVGGIQPGVLRSAIGREHMQDGLCARLLLAMPEPKPVRWSESTVSPATEAAMAKVYERLLSLEPAADEEGHPAPFAMPLTPEAKEIWVSYYNRHRAELAELDDDLAAAWSKLEAYAARFALIFQLAAWAQGEAGGDAVDQSSMEAGIKLADWFGGEARRVYDLFVETDSDREQRQLIELIQRKGGKITARELTHACRQYRVGGEAEAALERLAQSRIGKWEVEPTAGRSRTVFILVGNAGNGNTSMEIPEKTTIPLPLPPLPGGNGEAGEAP